MNPPDVGNVTLVNFERGNAEINLGFLCESSVLPDRKFIMKVNIETDETASDFTDEEVAQIAFEKIREDVVRKMTTGG
jgi:hypothetical protein